MSDFVEPVRDGDVIEIRFPASSVYVSMLRQTVAGLAARLDFTLDEIDDLRIAVDEACALLLPDATEGSHLVCRFTLAKHELQIAVLATTRSGVIPGPGSFAWTVLTALAGDVDVDKADNNEVTIRLHKARSAPP